MDEPFALRLHRPAPVRKGEKTREAILNDAVSLASQVGLEGLSIGALALRTGMSKSGLFAHFGSKEDLQLATLARAEALFEQRVFQPALAFAPGVARLRSLLDHWLRWVDGSQDLPGGCVLLSAASEYDDRPGPVRDQLAEGQRALRGAVAKAVRSAIDTGELDADVDPWQFTFELFGIVLAAYHERRLLDDRRAAERAQKAFQRLIARNKAP
jgi:AcrR family transcriptional regulator